MNAFVRRAAALASTEIPARARLLRVLAPGLLLATALAGCASTSAAPPAAGPSPTHGSVGATATDRSPASRTANQAPNAEAETDGRMLGAADAPVTIIEFTDLQCPYCARFARTTFPQLRTLYIETGKVRFASRDFPLPFHPFALPAAIAARCAERQGKYWEFREAVFQRQGELAREPYDDIASSLGLDRAQLASCRKDPTVRERVEGDVALGQSTGIDGTPSFVIGRRVGDHFEADVVSGALPIEAFAAKIDALLQQPQPAHQ
jgi:protein-disulfide isomerase